MSKSILVIDTPEDCSKCDLKNGYFCGKTKCWIDEDCFPKPDWCPLKDVPDKYYPVGMNFERGWNACIDEILKGANGNDERNIIPCKADR